MQQTTNYPRLIALVDWNRHHGAPSQSMLRKLVFEKHTNGFKNVITRIGKKIYLDEAKFFQWLEEHNA